MPFRSPKPVFQPVNGRKLQSKTQPEISPIHEEIIRYMGDAWNRVSRDLQASEEAAKNGSTDPPKVVRWEPSSDGPPEERPVAVLLMQFGLFSVAHPEAVGWSLPVARFSFDA
ncbi:unnamed protein product [Notodromas monacha]|uniref:Uncharacterized protein n=1 Tax=Notodromas monacha TaxID=399045 RepID=A0A7R9GBN9_9CRUS|nr:unnamed protein product [Notodromas monacha]CAG0916727.1 unnamed protein product [Notodromas monacha]